MLTQSDAAIAAWRATERTLDAKVSITDSDGNVTDYGTTDITSIAYDSGAFSGDTFSIGSTYENSITVTFAHLVEGLKQGYKVTAKIGIKLPDGTYEYCPLGVFIISDDISMDRNNDITTIKCYDQFCVMEGTYTSSLTYPAKVTDVIAEIANNSGVLLNTNDIAELPTQSDIASAITGQTYRVAIGWIAQFYGGFAVFDRDGQLTIRTVTDASYILDPSQYEQSGLTKNEATYTIGGMSVSVTTTTTDSTGESSDTTSTLTAGSTSGSQIELTNNVMTQARLDDIWSTIKDITFYPYSVTWFGNPAIEAGDWLTLKDTAGNSFNVPNCSYTMTFDGGLTSTSQADQTSTSSSSYSYSGTLSQTVKQLAGRQGATGNYIFGTDTTVEPTTAKIGDQWYKQNGNKIELWQYVKQSDGTGKWNLIVSDLTNVEISEQVLTAQEDATSAKTTANEAINSLTIVQEDVTALKGGSTLTIAELETGLSTKVSSDEYESKLTQVNDDINLRVEKNDVINQINVSTESILIAGNKVHITGTTTIDDAVITSAMIDSLSASKLTAGTIDASLVNVINLNANNISTGTISGSNLSINLTTGSILFQKGSIKSSNGTLDIEIDSGTMNVVDSSGNGFYFRNGNLFLSSDDNWSKNGITYGLITYNPQFLSYGAGMSIIGYKGFLLGTTTSSITSNGIAGSLVTPSMYYSSGNLDDIGGFVSGAGIASDGTNLVVGSNTGRIDINGGSSFTTNSWGYQPAVIVGTNASRSAVGSEVHLIGSNVVVEYGGFIATDGGSHIRNTQIDNELWVNGKFSVSGSKNAIVKTSKGWTQINAYETAEYYFGDIGKVNTGSGSKVKILMDSLFLETVNTSVGYHVFISSYGNGYAWVSEQTNNYFVIESSTPSLDVSYEIKAKRLGYENTRLEIDEDFEEKFDTAS